MNWENNIDAFIKFSNEYGVRMIMVGGGAVNFHGYQRHSADVDFWIETTDANLERLIKVFKSMGYEIDDFPESVKQQLQNISIKFSPMEMDIELITRFSINKSFDEAFKESEEVIVKNQKFLRWRVLSYDDLILSKTKANRPKDLLDIQQLKRLNNQN
jgi:hypothetical protein